MIWKNLAAQFAPLIPVFRGPFLPAETRTGGDNFEPNFCGNIDLKNLGDEFLSYYEYGTTRCLCMGKIPTLLAHPDSHLSSAILRFGIEETRERLESLVKLAHDVCEATHPPYSKPLCTQKNPCGFRCDSGRVEIDGQCACEPGTRECGELCCPLERSYLEQAAQQRFFRKPKLGDSRCEAGKEICSVPGTQNGWECLNVMEAKESCGGCAYSFYVGQKIGVDCTALPGARDTFCFMGQCQIHECTAGWEPASDRSFCERLPGNFPKSMSLGADELDELGISAEGAHAKTPWISGRTERPKPAGPKNLVGGDTDTKKTRSNGKRSFEGTGSAGEHSTDDQRRITRHDPKPKQRSVLRSGQDSFPVM